jgi:two-component system, chemotaxis family, chemotaxis protein CheY
VRVMVVDDSKAMRSIQRTVLEKLGHTEVLEATDGQDAMSKAQAFRPDLILVDWNMPVMDGLSFVKAWRATNKTTPIIMVTREAEKRRVVEAIAAGVNAYVVKPFTPDFLSQRIEETLARCGAAARG